jgi:Exostosin family
MRIHVAVVGSEGEHLASRDRFHELAAADAVREHGVAAVAERSDAILFVDLHRHRSDPFLRGLRKHPLVRAHRDKIFVYDERDQPFFTFPGIYVSGTPRWAARYGSMVGGPYASQGASPAVETEPDLLFSFVGSRTHPLRDVVLTTRHPRGLIEDTTGVDFFAAGDDSNARRAAARASYREALARSKFVLCPRGYGSSSIRLYETLRAGRVPVVISDEWLPPPRLPWREFIVRVEERQAPEVPRLLERLEERWLELVAAATRVQASELGPDRLWNHYASSIAELSRRSRRRSRHVWWADRHMLRAGAEMALGRRDRTAV